MLEVTEPPRSPYKVCTYNIARKQTNRKGNCKQINPTAANNTFKPGFRIDRSTCTRTSFHQNIKEIRTISA